MYATPAVAQAEFPITGRLAPVVPRERDNASRISVRELARLLQIELNALTGLTAVDGEAFTTRRVKPGETLVRAGDAFESLYVVRSGFFKTIDLDTAGAEQVIGFPMVGDIIGIDGIDTNEHTADVLALDHADVVIVPFARLARLAKSCPALEQLVYRALSRELVREQRLVRMLGSLHAEARVAAFLLNMSERFNRMGYSRTQFNLRMTRQEIGSYLGLQLETVSRALSRFTREGLTRVQQKSVELLDLEGLRAIAA